MGGGHAQAKLTSTPSLRALAKWALPSRDLPNLHLEIVSLHAAREEKHHAFQRKSTRAPPLRALAEGPHWQTKDSGLGKNRKPVTTKV